MPSCATGYRHRSFVTSCIAVTLRNTELPLSHLRSITHDVLSCGRNFGMPFAVYTYKRDWYLKKSHGKMEGHHGTRLE